MISEEILINMETYGGSFVQELVGIYRIADTLNRKKLEDTFKDYFESYENFGDTGLGTKTKFFKYFNSSLYQKELNDEEKFKVFTESLRGIEVLPIEFIEELLYRFPNSNVEVMSKEAAEQMREDISSLRDLYDEISTKLQEKSDQGLKF